MKVIIFACVILTLSVVGYWIPRPLSEAEASVVVNRLLRDRHNICDYQESYGYIVPKNCKKYLNGVTEIKWVPMDEDELKKFIDRSGADYVFYGHIRVKRSIFLTEIDIGNWPVVAKNNKNLMLLCGGTTTLTVAKRLPSILGLFFDGIIIYDRSQIMG